MVGSVGLVKLGVSRVVFGYGGRRVAGLVEAWHDPLFIVRGDEGPRRRLRARLMAETLLFSPYDFADPERYFFDWSRFNPAAVAGWRAGLVAAVEDAGLTVPSAWIGEVGCDVAGGVDGPTDRVEAFRAAERARLGGVIDVLSGGARARATIMGLRNYGLKLLWWLVSRGLDINLPTPRALAMAFAFLVDLRGNAAAAQKTAEACAFIGRLNDWPEGLLDGAARVPLDAARRIYRHQVRKVRGLELGHVRLILEHFAYLRADLPIARQWRFAVGTAFGAGFKVFARFDDLKQMQWGDEFCSVYDSHIDFIVEHRKNRQFQGDTVTVARPTDGSAGVYGVLVLARQTFRSGFVLPHVDAQGCVDLSRPMEYSAFVRHLRAALVFIGLSEEEAGEFAAHSMRAGAATEAGPKLSPQAICLAAGVSDLNWILGYHRASIADRISASHAVGL